MQRAERIIFMLDHNEQKKIADFANDVHSGKIVNEKGEKFTTVCQIGIGGSDLGPRAMYLALENWAKNNNTFKMEAKFISNVDPDDAAGVLSTMDLAKTMLDRGFYFSASGILTFKNAESVRETFAKIPMDRIVVETDSPYCAPVPYRGKICEPAFVIETARALAQIKNLQIDELKGILYENTQRLYPKCHVKL